MSEHVLRNPPQQDSIAMTVLKGMVWGVFPLFKQMPYTKNPWLRRTRRIPALLALIWTVSVLMDLWSFFVHGNRDGLFEMRAVMNVSLYYGTYLSWKFRHQRFFD